MEYNLNALCQSLRLEGMSSSDEKSVELEIRQLLRHNGPEFVIDRLKIMKQHSIDQLTDPCAHVNFVDGSQSIAWNHKSNMPKGAFSRIYTTWVTPESRIRGIGAAINSITLECATPKQIEKFVSGIKSKTRSTSVAPVTDSEARTFVATLFKQSRMLRPYSGRELTAAIAPEGVLKRNIGMFKKDLQSDDAYRRHKALAELDAAVENQYVFAPRASSDFYHKKLRLVNPDLPKYAKHAKGEKSRPYEFEKYKAYGNAEDYAPYAGQIGFIQQPGGKLRTVCNTNRFINYTLTPYHKALEAAFYHDESVFVARQDLGLDRLQTKLSEGVTMSSADLTQATDLLDFRVFTRGLREAVLRVKENPGNFYKRPEFAAQSWQKYDNATQADLVAMGNVAQAISLALNTIEYFEYVAELPFYCPDLDEGFAFSTGQPLGMKGSFPTLTAMNLLAMRQATQYAKDDGLDISWADMRYAVAVVGDDACMPATLSPYYSRVISEWGGKDNSEKSLQSDRYGEFCSTLVTPSTMVRMKPKYRPGKDALYINAEKTTLSRMQHVYRLSLDDKNNLATLAQCYGHSMLEPDSVKGPNLLPFEDRMILQRAVRLMASFTNSGGLPENLTVSRQTLDYAHEVHDAYRGNDRIGDNRTYVRTPDGNVVYTGVQSVVNHENGSFPLTVDTFDHDTNQRVARTSLSQANSSKRETAKALTALKEAWFDGKTSELSIGNGMKMSTDDLLLGAVALTPESESPKSFIDLGREEEKKISRAVKHVQAKRKATHAMPQHSSEPESDDFDFEL